MGVHEAGARLRGRVVGARTRLWPVPLAAVLAAVGLGILLPGLDRAWSTSAGGDATSLHLFGGGADAARGVLSTIAGSLVTATSLTFSLTVVTLQLASSQYSPRLLRTFTRDGVVQVTLGTFLATFTYALAVLRVVRSQSTDTPVDDVFVPRLSVTVAVLLTLASVLALVLFLAHLAREIRVETVLARVHEEAIDVVGRVYPATVEDRPEPARPPQGPSVVVRAPATGFLTTADHEALAAVGRRCDGVVVVDSRVGDFVVAGSPLGRVHAGQDRDGDRAARDAAEAMRIEDERTAFQDPGFGLRQIADVAVRALSPGVNDPTTAVHALGWAGALLVDAAGRDCGPVLMTDDDGTLRAVVARPSFADLMAVALEQPLHYGMGDPQVALRLATLLDELAAVTTTADHRITVRAWLGRLAEAARDAAIPDHARSGVRLVVDRAGRTLDAEA